MQKIKISQSYLKLLKAIYDETEVFTDLSVNMDPISESLKLTLSKVNLENTKNALTDSQINELSELNLQDAEYCLKIFQEFKKKFNTVAQYKLTQRIGATVEKMSYKKSATAAQDIIKSFASLCLTMEKAKIGYFIQEWESKNDASSNTYIRQTLSKNFVSANTPQVNHMLMSYINNLQKDIDTYIDLNKAFILEQKQEAVIERFCVGKDINEENITDPKTRQAIILIQLYKDNYVNNDHIAFRSHENLKETSELEQQEFTAAIQEVFGMTHPEHHNITELIKIFDDLYKSGKLNTCYKEPGLLDKIISLVANMLPNTEWAQKILENRQKRKFIKNCLNISQ